MSLMSSSSLRRPALARATAPVILLTAVLPALPASADIGSLRWEQWHSQAGVVDVDGPLSTGELVVAAGQHLFRLSPGGGESELAAAYAVSPLAPPPGSEPYIAVAPPEVS